MKINSIDVAVSVFTAISISLLGIWLFFDSSIPVKYIYYPIAGGAVFLAIGAVIEFIYTTLRNIIRRKELEALDKALTNVLKRKGKDVCPNCGCTIDRGDMAWNNGCTEYGTGYCVVECQCQQCDTELFKFDSWYPSIDDTNDLAHVIDEELEDV